MDSNPGNTTPPLATPESIIQELDISKFVQQGEEPTPVLSGALPPSLIGSAPLSPPPTSTSVPSVPEPAQKNPPSPTQPSLGSSQEKKLQTTPPQPGSPLGQSAVNPQSPKPSQPTHTPSQGTQVPSVPSTVPTAPGTPTATVPTTPTTLSLPTPTLAPPPPAGATPSTPTTGIHLVIPTSTPVAPATPPTAPTAPQQATLQVTPQRAPSPVLRPTPVQPTVTQGIQSPPLSAQAQLHRQSSPIPSVPSPSLNLIPQPVQNLPSLQSPLSPQQAAQPPSQGQQSTLPAPQPQSQASQPPQPIPSPQTSPLSQAQAQSQSHPQPPSQPQLPSQSQLPQIQSPHQPIHSPVQLTPIHPPQQPPSPLPHLGGSHLPHALAQQGPIQPTPQASAQNPQAPPSPVLPSLPPLPTQAPLPPPSQSIPPTLPAAPIQPIQSIQPVAIQHQQVPQSQQPMQHQLQHQLPHPSMHSQMQHQMPQMHQQMQQQMQTPPSLPPPQGGANRVSPPSPYNSHPAQPARQIKFENALEFLDQVKLQFSKQPRVYNQFLDIMKDFKAQYIDTPGVIARVSELFKGHKHLILGFNTFLPPGYKIEIPDDDKPPQITQPPPPSHPPMQANAQLAAPNPPAGGRKQPEFDHARSYVKKIKTRFQMQPTVYKSFLDILHAYHKEQHTIKDVYDQVATLFASHADLLDEFTQFLPDPVASANAAIPPPTSPTAQAIPTGRDSRKTSRTGRVFPKKAGSAAPPSPESKPQRKRPASARRDEAPAKRVVYNEDYYERVPASPPSITTPKEDEGKMPLVEGTFEELDFFNRVKSALDNPKLYHEFLKCLNLYSQEIISRVELVLLVKDLLSRYPDLFDWFKHFIGFDEASMELLEKKEAMALEDNRQPWSEIDYTTCERYGPSYRALPANYGTPRCSGRTELCWAVLNDIWVSVPTGSEDFTFKNQRKNQYEEVLFKCEDERYELDLVIELNTSAIRALEPIKQKLAGLTEEEAATFKMESLDPLHARSIERIYGDKGVEILEGIYANPSIAVPIVLQRLKQKDFEWHKSKQEWDKVWREITAKNYHKSLDHQSFFFKQAEKKALSPKVLLAEIKQQYADKLREQQEGGRRRHKNRERVPWHLQYTFNDMQVFQDISDLIVFAAEKLLSRSDKEKIDTFLKHFLQVFFRVEDIYKQPSPPATPPASAPRSPPHAPAPSSTAAAPATTAAPSAPPTTPPPTSPTHAGATATGTENSREPAQEREKDPTTPPTPNLNVTEIKLENDGEKNDVVMEDAQPVATATTEAPSTTSSEPTSTSTSEKKEGTEAEKEKGKEEAPKIKSEKGEGKEKEAEEEKVRRIRKIFFGNNAFYVFFRLYQIMYDRLAKGKELGLQSSKAKWNARPVRVPKANGEAPGLGSPDAEGKLSEKDSGKEIEKGKAPAKDKDMEKDDGHDKDRYQAFLEKLYSLLAGAMDVNHYEDECRSLLGISSYVLFTMDKLVVQITRQLQAMMCSEPCAKLLSLFMYETVRPQGMQENAYHAGCAELLRDERMFLFEFEQVPNPARFTIQLLDSTNQPVPRFMEFNFEPGKYSEYVASFQKDSSKIDPKKHHVFLLRNQKHTRDNPTILREVISSNRLECRICLSTYKLFYVEDTEDFFYRPPRSRPSISPASAERREKKRKINYEKLGVAPPPPPPASTLPGDDNAMKI
eukprot:Phypoly_transcript_00301.p1 GENE.Phypoly_transcript_00301~~Phypoly_transcript_00301.p1  ORF type:complete len:1683 (+),score=475.87 Phypoly_transcript_00301:157-5205(+)